MLKDIVKYIVSQTGYTFNKTENDLIKDGMPVDINEKKFINIFNDCRPFTFTTVEPMYTLYNSVKYIVENKIAGDIVECGVWKGGSAMLIAKTLMELNDTSRKIYLYDTYEGMSEPTNKDVDYRGNSAEHLLQVTDKNLKKSVWCNSSIDEVKQNLYSTEYPRENIIFIKGKVENTIPETIPTNISLLRLDTDWYESTLHEFIHLYPLLSINGVLIIDDYGHWKGARDATDKYFRDNNITMLLNRIDYTVRLGIKNK